jgi:putative methionine-R-sulfoxide reductase with GAF domain
MAREASSSQELMRGIAQLLNQKMLKYNWVGFYMLEKEDDQDVLMLGPFSGSMTPHTRIPLNKVFAAPLPPTARPSLWTT